MFIKSKLEDVLSQPSLLAEAIMDVFQQIDLNENGSVEEDELFIFVRKFSLVMIRPVLTRDEVHDLFTSLDKNKQDRLSKIEMESYIIGLLKIMVEAEANTY